MPLAALGATSAAAASYAAAAACRPSRCRAAAACAKVVQQGLAALPFRFAPAAAILALAPSFAAARGVLPEELLQGLGDQRLGGGHQRLTRRRPRAAAHLYSEW